ncbi:MAG: hypothetical protein OER90_13585 [Gemmatimonadota bacterium]|nr:hypothetical protein [Gemmatimonadota bacterium]
MGSRVGPHQSPLAAIAFAALLAGGLVGCEDTAEPSGVLVRLVNASIVTMTRATLYTSEGPVSFQDLEAGAASPFISVSVAYRFATTEVVAATDTFRLQVIDFVGETPLEPGLYSYVLDVIDLGTPNASLTQEFRRDR